MSLNTVHILYVLDMQETSGCLSYMTVVVWLDSGNKMTFLDLGEEKALVKITLVMSHTSCNVCYKCEISSKLYVI